MDHNKMMRKFVGTAMRYPNKARKRQGEGGDRLRSAPKISRPGKPLVTVITVCYNSAKTISKTIRSIRDQSYDNIEYVVVDGGSSDGTLDILKCNGDIIDYFVSEADDGLYHAMNKGLELAQGDYILMLNSDDWYVPETVEKLVEAVVYSGCDFTGALARYINPNGTSHVLRTMPFDHSVLLRMPLRHETMLIPAALYDRIGSYNTDYPIIADYEFSIRLFQAGASYYEVREPLLNFSTEGVSNTAKDRVDQETRALLKQVFPFLSDDALRRITDHATVGPETFIELANAHQDQPDFVRAVRGLLADRKLHSGKRWQGADLDAVAPSSPKVSVIVPVHNAERSLEASLETALGQDLENIEVICVDDCSEDKSAEIVVAIAERDPRVRLLRNKVNLGPGGSRNVGIRAARGRYAFFLDADDAIAPGALTKLYDAAQANNSTIVRGGFRADQVVHGQQGKGTVKFPAGNGSTFVANTTLAKTPGLLASTEGHWAALYDADFAETVLYPTDIRVGEDSFFLIKAYALAPSISLLPEVVYHYQDNPDSTMNRMTAAKYFDGLSWRERAYKVLHDAGLRDIGENLLFNFWSVPYFDGLDKVLLPEEKIAYARRLRDALNSTGLPLSRGTRDKALRARIDAVLAPLSVPTLAAVPIPAQHEAKGLRIATINTQDHGGAGLGTQRRVEALRKAGVDAHIYCAFQKTKHDYVHKLPYAAPLERSASLEVAREAWTEKSVLRRVEHPKLKARELFSKTGSIVDFRDLNAVFESADIVHMHWVSGVFDFDHTEVLADKPVAWTLADMNAFTGGCHYSEGCTKYREECRDCPLLEPGSTLAHDAWKRKRAAYANIKNLHVICPSQWLADCAKESSLFGDRPVHMIPNALPVDRFVPTNRLVARLKLGLPLDAKLVAFGADSLTNRRKGGDLLAKGIAQLKAKGKAKGVEGLFFGANSLDLGIPAHQMGHISDESHMSLIYAAADVFAFPSREDNAPLTVVESLLSGTPVVGFPVGNVPELVRHKETGYIARYGDEADFAAGLAWALLTPNSPETLMRGVRGHVAARRHNDPVRSVDRHIEVFREMMK